jgi:kynureninase
MNNAMPSIEAARALDAADPLAPFRAQFSIPDPDLIYLDGNSLGRLPLRAAELVRAVVEAQWGGRLVRGWGEGWYTAPRRIGEKIARLVGAAPGQVVISDSTSVNLFKMASAALHMQAASTQKRVVLTDSGNFPSDLYVLQGVVQALGQDWTLRVLPVEDDPAAADQAVMAAIDERTALVALSHAAFKSGALYDASAISHRARAAGALTLWDLSHSAGAAPVHLDAWGADFAVGCTYKYMNGGPGAPAFLYARSGLQEEAFSPIWGWFGEAQPFAFDLEYHPAQGPARFMAGTPAILSLLAVEPGVDLLLEAGIERLREKSLLQTQALIDLYDRDLAGLGFTLATPRDPDRRGSHVTLRHPEGYRINLALIEEMQVIPDFREPDHIRLGVAPIYTRFEDLWEATGRLGRVVTENRYTKYAAERGAVT